jgi:L-malate glycosyltransferase
MRHADGAQHLLHVFSTFAIGGPQTRFATLANRLGGKYRHTVISLDGDIGCASRLDPSVDAQVTALRLSKGGGLHLGNLMRIRRRLAALKPDLLLTYNWGAIEWALAQRWRPVVRRHIHLEDGFGPDEGADRQLRRRVLFRRLALGGPTRIVVPSRTLHRIATETWRLKPSAVLHIANGVDPARFAAPPDPAWAHRLGIIDGETVIGSLGALRTEKNIARLIRAFAALPKAAQARLVIAGGGPEAPALAALAGSLGIGDRVVFPGSVEQPERLLGHFDIFALSSDTEQMPYALLEAMATGLPVVATDVGDIAEMVAPGNRSFVVRASDQVGLVAALAEMLKSADRRDSLGQANQRRVCAAFALDDMIKQYDSLFSETAFPTPAAEHTV